ncbi:MAG: helix-turn-helix domain-containing protein [Pseudomonadota bacterium]
MNEVDPSILDALGRLLALNEEPEISPSLAPLVEDEIHLRLLHSSMSTILARLMWHDDNSTQIARVIKLMSDDLSRNLSIPELAETVGMSKSALHLHFKAVTGMSPLAYTKELRLLKAQSYVRDSNRPISMIGYDVGYESPAQFSREYSRKFHMSPRQDRFACR